MFIPQREQMKWMRDLDPVHGPTLSSIFYTTHTQQSTAEHSSQKTGPKATEIMVLVYSLSLIPISLLSAGREAGPLAMKFTKRGVINILEGSHPKMTGQHIRPPLLQDLSIQYMYIH